MLKKSNMKRCSKCGSLNKIKAGSKYCNSCIKYTAMLKRFKKKRRAAAAKRRKR